MNQRLTRQEKSSFTTISKKSPSLMESESSWEATRTAAVHGKQAWPRSSVFPGSPWCSSHWTQHPEAFHPRGHTDGPSQEQHGDTRVFLHSCMLCWASSASTRTCVPTWRSRRHKSPHLCIQVSVSHYISFSDFPTVPPKGFPRSKWSLTILNTLTN